jgi:hypothetical protein
MTTHDYRRALEAAIREYESLGEERRTIDRRLSEVAQTITALARLCGLTPTVSFGLAEWCRLVLRNAETPLSPVEVRDRLAALGLDMEKYASDLSVIHTTLKRLNQAGEIRFVPRSPGKHAYVWNRPSVPVVLGPEVVRHMLEQESHGAPLHSPSARKRKRSQ